VFGGIEEYHWKQREGGNGKDAKEYNAEEQREDILGIISLSDYHLTSRNESTRLLDGGREFTSGFHLTETVNCYECYFCRVFLVALRGLL
jgi:hypothetical protein